MARAGNSGLSRVRPARTGPRDFQLVKRHNSASTNDGVEKPRRPWTVDFNSVDVELYGGDPGGAVVIPENFFSFANATNGAFIDPCQLAWLKEDDWDEERSVSIAWKWPFIYELLQSTAVHPHLVP